MQNNDTSATIPRTYDLFFKKTTYLVNLQPLARLLRRKSPRKEHDASSGIVGVRQNGAEDGVCEGLPSFFGVRVGFVGADGEAGVEPENADFGEGGEVSRLVVVRM